MGAGVHYLCEVLGQLGAAQGAVEARVGVVTRRADDSPRRPLDAHHVHVGEPGLRHFLLNLLQAAAAVGPRTVTQQAKGTSLSCEGYQPSSPIHGDQLASLDLVRRLGYTDNGRNTVFSRDDCAMGARAAHLHHQAARRQEERSPAGIGRRCDQDFSWLEVRAHRIEHDSSPRGYSSC